MLTTNQADRIAEELVGRLGETALAAAVWQAQWAAAQGQAVRSRDWARIAEATSRALPV